MSRRASARRVPHDDASTFRGGIRLEKTLPEQPLAGDKRTFSQHERLPLDDSGAMATDSSSIGESLGVTTTVHNAFHEELLDIQDTHLLRTYTFAQLVAGHLGISSKAEMERVWAGPPPLSSTTSRPPSATATATECTHGLSQDQFTQLMEMFETLAGAMNVKKEKLVSRIQEEIVVDDDYDEDDDEELIGAKVRQQQQQQGTRTEVLPRPSAQLRERVETHRRSPENQPRGTTSTGRDPRALGTGRSIFIDTPTPAAPPTSLLYGKDLLRKLLLERSLSQADIDAVDSVSSSLPDQRRWTLKTVWGKVSFNASMASLTPSVMSAVRQAHERVMSKSRNRYISLDRLVLGPRVQNDFAILTSLLMNKAVATRSGTYSGSQQPQSLWSEVNLLLRKFERIYEDDDGDLSLGLGSQRYSPNKRRRLVRLYDANNEPRGRVVIIGEEVYKMGGGGGLVGPTSSSYQARRLARIVGGSFTPDYLTEALQSI